MTPSTPLPEQGGFNEKLDEILEHLLIDYDFDVKDKDSRTFDRAKQAIRTLVLEEIIGLDEIVERTPKGAPIYYQTDNKFNVLRNNLRAEQRKKLENSNGTK